MIIVTDYSTTSVVEKGSEGRWLKEVCIRMITTMDISAIFVEGRQWKGGGGERQWKEVEKEVEIRNDDDDTPYFPMNASHTF